MPGGRPLSSRMKGYEEETRLKLPRKTYSVIRVDGRAFHTWTKGLERPYSPAMMNAMAAATKALCEEVSGSILGYTQSDEISILCQDFVGKHTEPWFGGVVQKIASVSASIVTATFGEHFPDRAPAHFDSRVFAVPDASAAECYLNWRLWDARKNAVTMLASEHFSHKELLGLKTFERAAKLRDVGAPITEADERFLNGQVVRRASVAKKISYTDRRTGKRYTTPEPVERHYWTAEAGPKHFTADELPQKEDTDD